MLKARIAAGAIGLLQLVGAAVAQPPPAARQLIRIAEHERGDIKDRTKFHPYKLAWKDIALLDDRNVRAELGLTQDELPHVALIVQMLNQRDVEHWNAVAAGKTPRETKEFTKNRPVEDKGLLCEGLGEERYLRLLQIKRQFDGPLRSAHDPEVLTALGLRNPQMKELLNKVRDATYAWFERHGKSKGWKPSDPSLWDVQVRAFESGLREEQKHAWNDLVGKAVSFPPPKGWPEHFERPNPEHYITDEERKQRPQMPAALAQAKLLLRKASLLDPAGRFRALLEDANALKELTAAGATSAAAASACQALRQRDEALRMQIVAGSQRFGELRAARAKEDAALLEKALGKGAFLRLLQLQRQFDGPMRSAKDPAVASELEANGELLRAAFGAALRVGEIPPAPSGETPAQAFERVREHERKREAAFEAAMTPAQRRRWQELIGPKATFPAPEGWKDGIRMPVLPPPPGKSASKDSR